MERDDLFEDKAEKFIMSIEIYKYFHQKLFLLNLKIYHIYYNL
jgi:hypothetical protein